MSDLPIKTLTIQETKSLNDKDFHISLKLDGTLLYYLEKNLVSERACVRNSRFGHIKKILDENNFPECYGEMFISEDSNVFAVSSKENWSKAKFMIIDLVDRQDLKYADRMKLIETKISQIKNNTSIQKLILFPTIKQGWDYVVKNEREGLILRNDNQFYKIKLLKEVKIEIIAHKESLEKGTFILANGSSCSGTSVAYVEQYKNLKAQGKTPIAEIEYPFLTKDGNYFQPRLRRIFALEDGEKSSTKIITGKDFI